MYESRHASPEKDYTFKGKNYIIPTFDKPGHFSRIRMLSGKFWLIRTNNYKQINALNSAEYYFDVLGNFTTW